MGKRNILKWAALAAACPLLLALAACGGSPAQNDAPKQEPNASTEAMIEAETANAPAEAGENVKAPDGTPVEAAWIYVQGYEWGPGVPKIIMQLPEVPAAADSLSKEGALAVTNGVRREVTNVGFSDSAGEFTGEPSEYVTLELATNYAASGSPFDYDMSVMMNKWAKEYPVVAAAVVGGETYVIDADLIDSRVCPETEAFPERGEYGGEYLNRMNKEMEEYTLRYAANAPDALLNDGAQNPLIVWLHGQGEGGTDVDIALIGNEVVALNREEIQSQFTTPGGANGAYVLAVQCETYWMDGGDGTNSGGDVMSRYTEILMDAIEDFVRAHPDVDPNRVYLGGCSNGGYMTMNMLTTYPDYWAAAYPNCEAYAWAIFEKGADGKYAYGEDGGYRMTSDRWMTDEKIQAIKDIPIWFVNARQDPVVKPELFSMPTYRALLQAGAENAWYSMFDTVPGTDDPGAEYMAHFAWVYTFNNQVTGVQDRDAIKNAADDENMGFAPDNNGGGALKAVDADGNQYDNLFAWMNAQKKA
ncbi:MAG: prolyl oligopeptidase family serine peptidase [Oscillibacter sp.]|nr:prolyl oligopeptidase family serine peptidase [Oscillibacter sp.]